MNKDILLIILIVGLVAGGIAGFYFMDADGIAQTKHGSIFAITNYEKLLDPNEPIEVWTIDHKLNATVNHELVNFYDYHPILLGAYPHDHDISFQEVKFTDKYQEEGVIKEYENSLNQDNKWAVIFYLIRDIETQQEIIDHLESELGKQIQRQIEFEKDLTELRQEINNLKNQ